MHLRRRQTNPPPILLIPIGTLRAVRYLFAAFHKPDTGETVRRHRIRTYEVACTGTATQRCNRRVKIDKYSRIFEIKPRFVIDLPRFRVAPGEIERAAREPTVLVTNFSPGFTQFLAPTVT